MQKLERNGSILRYRSKEMKLYIRREKRALKTQIHLAMGEGRKQ